MKDFVDCVEALVGLVEVSVRQRTRSGPFRFRLCVEIVSETSQPSLEVAHSDELTGVYGAWRAPTHEWAWTRRVILRLAGHKDALFSHYAEHSNPTSRACVVLYVEEEQSSRRLNLTAHLSNKDKAPVTDSTDAVYIQMVPCKSGFTPDVSLNIETRLTGTELAVPPLSPASPAPPLPALELRESAYRRLSAALKSWEVPAHLPPAPKIVIPRDGQPPRPAPSPVAKALPESVAGDESIRDILGVVSRKIPVLRDSVRTTQAQLLDQLVGLFKLGVTQVPAPSTFWRPATSPPVRTPTILDLPLPELSALSDSGGEPVRLFIGEVTEAHREAVDWLGTPESDEVVRALTPHTLSTAAGTLVHLLSLLTRILGVQNKLTFIPVADAAVPRLEKKFTKSSNFTSEGVSSVWFAEGTSLAFPGRSQVKWSVPQESFFEVYYNNSSQFSAFLRTYRLLTLVSRELCAAVGITNSSECNPLVNAALVLKKMLDMPA